MKHADRRSGVAVLGFAAAILPLFLCVGLAIDASILFVIKSKLSAAVDAGALAGARALSRGNDDAAQRTRAQEVASAYVRANFPDGYIMTRNRTINQPTITLTGAHQRSVSVTASVQAPAFFMKVAPAFMGGSWTDTTVRAMATAIRRDVNIVLVLDRSRSMNVSSSCDELRSSAASFAGKFAPGRDNLGLVTYATSSATEFAMGNNFATASTTMYTRINNITCQSGGTSSADGLSRGYWELAGLNQPAALNIILFFTDGEPTAIHGTFTMTTGGSCPASARPTMPGVWTVGGSEIWGLLSPSNGLSPVVDDNRPSPNAVGATTCSFAQNWPSNTANQTPPNADDTSAYLFVPDTDVWGNSLDTGYRTPITRTNITGYGNRIAKSNASNVRPAAYNAADDAARRIRIGAVMNGRSLTGVGIFAIGLGNSDEPANETFMLRVANDPRSPIYTTAQREGLYVPAPTAADLHSAFTRIASEILRLSQ
jgi:Flp pilus assembly protein TadG